MAVVVSVERWNDLQETLEELEDTVAVLDHRLSRRRGKPSEAVFAAIEAEEAGVRGPSRRTG